MTGTFGPSQGAITFGSNGGEKSMAVPGDDLTFEVELQLQMAIRF